MTHSWILPFEGLVLLSRRRRSRSGPGQRISSREPRPGISRVRSQSLNLCRSLPPLIDYARPLQFLPPPARYGRRNAGPGPEFPRNSGIISTLSTPLTNSLKERYFYRSITEYVGVSQDKNPDLQIFQGNNSAEYRLPEYFDIQAGTPSSFVIIGSFPFLSLADLGGYHPVGQRIGSVDPVVWWATGSRKIPARDAPPDPR
jgi:hypothetical protein